MKKSERVYNSVNICPFCMKCQKNFSHHLFSKRHENEKEVKEIFLLGKKETEKGRNKKQAIEKLRLQGNHRHNLQILEKKKGELIVTRRSNQDTLDHKEYGPCPTCFGWMLIKTLKRHSKKCIGNTQGEIVSGVCLAVQSKVLVGRMNSKASKGLVTEVFTIMQNDAVSQVAQEDPLIVSLGNQWLKRNMGNRIMRKYYTSQAMRLMARLLIELQKLSGQQLHLDDYIKPAHFDLVVKAALVCGKNNMDSGDDKELQSPSNAIKLGYDLKRVASVKLAEAIMSENDEQKKSAKDFLRLMTMKWGLRVTKIARVLLSETQFNVKVTLPLPEDLEKLTVHMDDVFKAFDVKDETRRNFKHGATYALAKLTLYNSRRYHEVQALRLDSYSQRKTGVDQVSMGLYQELSDWEKKLLETQEIVEMRDKRGRGVPVIIPNRVGHILQYLTNQTVRNAVDITSKNPYVFASGAGVVRAYDAIRKVADSAGLKMPGMIRTPNMRKYMATMIQSLETTETQRQWICDHLGHNMDIHRTYYRQSSDILERVEVAKLLLIQDFNMVPNFSGKTMAEIQLEDIVTAGTEGQSDAPDRDTLDDCESETIPDLYSFEEEEEMQFRTATAKENCNNTTRLKKTVHRQMWSAEEEKELKVRFAKNFFKLKCPNRREIDAAVRRSVKSRGLIHQRPIDNIKKKVSNMIIKIRKVGKH